MGGPHAYSGKPEQALGLKSNAQCSNRKDSVSPVQVHQDQMAYSFSFPSSEGKMEEIKFTYTSVFGSLAENVQTGEKT